MENGGATRSLTAIALAALVLLLATWVMACGSDSVDGAATTGSISSSASETPQPLLVATASSLKAAFTEIGEAFDQANNSQTTFTFDASGVLQKQIEAGAPVDVFVSAAPTQVNNLLEKNLVDEESVTTFASNEMVLAVPADSTLAIASFQDLTKDEVEKVTTADPETAPQGKAAIEVLTSLDILEAVQPKLVYSKNASQTLTYVVQGEVDAGIMFATDAISGGSDVKVVATSQPDWHSEIAYVMAAVSASEAKTLGKAFVDFVAGPEGSSILEKHGFLIP